MSKVILVKMCNAFRVAFTYKCGTGNFNIEGYEALNLSLNLTFWELGQHLLFAVAHIFGIEG